MGNVIAALGIPTALMGFLVWLLKRHIDKRDRERAEEEAKREAARQTREDNTQRLMLMIMQTSRATNVLAEATAKAVQRIPDARCNGDMKAALERAEQIQKEEQAFLIDQGVKHIFGD